MSKVMVAVDTKYKGGSLTILDKTQNYFKMVGLLINNESTTIKGKCNITP